MADMVIGKYIRLSLEDRDIGNGKQESSSIGHQRDLIENYISGHSDLAACRQMEFFDDGFSGTSFARPAFEKMMDKVKCGEITCIIVKDFSRFGRDYIELGDYLERIFPFLGVRFISVNDGYDSNDHKGTTGGLEVVMKNIVYDYYSKDLSVKVKSAKMQKMKKGNYLGGHIPYGLIKNPEDKRSLVLDDEAAEVVRDIFDYRLSGMKLVDIARTLNSDGIETPSQYFRRKNPKAKNYGNVSKHVCWTVHAVRSILTNEIYYGAVVNHKREAVTVGGRHTRAVPKEEQIIVEDRHPGIVTKEEFLEVQSSFRKGYARKYETKQYLFKGLVKCGYCGESMKHKYSVVVGKYPNSCWYCSRATYRPELGCCKYIRDDVLESVVWESVKGMASTLEYCKGKLKKAVEESSVQKVEIAREIAELERKQKKCISERFICMDAYMDEKISKDEFQNRKTELTCQIDQLGKMLEAKNTKLKELELQGNEATKEAIGIFEQVVRENKLTDGLAKVLVKEIKVYDEKHVEITWNFSEEVVKFILGV